MVKLLYIHIIFSSLFSCNRNSGTGPYLFRQELKSINEMLNERMALAYYKVGR